MSAQRDAHNSRFGNLQRLGTREQVRRKSLALKDFRNVLQVLVETKPHEIYNLAGQSSIGVSFYQPVQTIESIATGTPNVLEAARVLKLSSRLYSSCSKVCFGDSGDYPVSKGSAFRPRRSYSVAKAAAFWMVANYREAYGLFAVTVRLLPRCLGLEAGGEFGIVDEVIEELVPGLGRETRFAEHVRQLFDAVIG